MDSPEFGIGEDIARESLDKRYTTMGESIATLYQLTSPPEEPKRWIRRIRDFDFKRAKDTRATNTLTHIKDVFNTHFPNSSEQDQVIEAANNYLHNLANSINTNEKDQADYDDLANFISNFPDTLVTHLGEMGTPETTARILQIGTSAIATHMQDVEERGYPTNQRLRFISELVASRIPQAISNAGDAKEDLLEKFEKTAKSQSFRELDSMATFYERGIYVPSETTVGDINALQEHIATVEPQIDTSSSPFNQPDREAWKSRELLMGSENRSPSWKDLADMITSTAEDDIEYGLTFSTDPKDGSIRIDYKRGQFGKVSNGGNLDNRNGIIFFHAHPSHTSVNHPGRSEKYAQVVAPLLSSGIDPISNTPQGDLLAADHGGGYFNIVTIKGLTIQTGIEPYVSLPGDVTEQDTQDEVYVIESGKMKDSWFTSDVQKQEEKTMEVMQGVYDEGKPFAYSIYEPAYKRRRYFMHIPWDKIDGDISLKQVLYGNGLQELSKKIENLPQIPIAKNVLEGLKK